MARLSGRNGALYANITSGGTAEPIAYLNTWSLDQSTPKIKVTAFGDTSEIYVAGLPDAQGKYSGFYDSATAQLYTAATDGVARKFYLYPDRTNTAQYWFGTAIFDFSISVKSDSSVDISGGFAAASLTAKVG